jgi:hypothetical protein
MFYQKKWVIFLFIFLIQCVFSHGNHDHDHHEHDISSSKPDPFSIPTRKLFAILSCTMISLVSLIGLILFKLQSKNLLIFLSSMVLLNLIQI